MIPYHNKWVGRDSKARAKECGNNKSGNGIVRGMEGTDGDLGRQRERQTKVRQTSIKEIVERSPLEYSLKVVQPQKE